MKKKFLLVSFYFIMSFVLCACAKETKLSTQGEADVETSTSENVQESSQENQAGDEQQEDVTDGESTDEESKNEESTDDESMDEESKEEALTDEESMDEESKEEALTDEDSSDVVENMGVKAQIQVYEGSYFDESVYQYITDPDKDASSFTYCIISISNVTDTSFEFEVNEITYTTEASEVVVPKSIAVFIDDGTKAAYYGEDQTIYFEFPDREEDFPKHIKVTGFEKLEGNSYMNNSIPGHESGSIKSTTFSI